jgi:hypothetical protein
MCAVRVSRVSILKGIHAKQDKKGRHYFKWWRFAYAFGHILLYIKARYNIISGDIFCMRRDNFHYIDSRNIAIILAF